MRVATGTGTRAERIDKKELKQRHWKSIGHPTCYGRFVPDTEDEKLRDGSYRKPKHGENFEKWMLRVTTKEVGIEVNVQISEFTLQNHKMMLLDPSIMKHKDFQHTRKTVLTGASDVACAEVVHTTNRYHWRLVGQRYDVMSWAPDKRNYHDIKGALNHDYSRKFPSKLRPGETWIAEVLLEKLPLILPDVTLYMSPNDQSNSPFAHLYGWIENPSQGDITFTHTLKEVVVSHNPPVVTVFNVKEYGEWEGGAALYYITISICSQLTDDHCTLHSHNLIRRSSALTNSRIHIQHVSLSTRSFWRTISRSCWWCVGNVWGHSHDNGLTRAIADHYSCTKL